VTMFSAVAPAAPAIIPLVMPVSTRAISGQPELAKHAEPLAAATPLSELVLDEPADLHAPDAVDLRTERLL